MEKIEIRPEAVFSICENARCGRDGGNAKARARSRSDEHTNQKERKAGRGCLTGTQKKRKGGNGPICLVSSRPDAGVFISGVIHTRQVLYEMRGELKGARESTSGARG